MTQFNSFFLLKLYSCKGAFSSSFFSSPYFLSSWQQKQQTLTTTITILFDSIVLCAVSSTITQYVPISFLFVSFFFLLEKKNQIIKYLIHRSLYLLLSVLLLVLACLLALLIALISTSTCNNDDVFKLMSIIIYLLYFFSFFLSFFRSPSLYRYNRSQCISKVKKFFFFIFLSFFSKIILWSYQQINEMKWRIEAAVCCLFLSFKTEDR